MIASKWLGDMPSVIARDHHKFAPITLQAERRVKRDSLVALEIDFSRTQRVNAFVEQILIPDVSLLGIRRDIQPGFGPVERRKFGVIDDDDVSHALCNRSET